jgi:hypothetical protein
MNYTSNPRSAYWDVHEVLCKIEITLSDAVETIIYKISMLLNNCQDMPAFIEDFFGSFFAHNNKFN